MILAPYGQIPGAYPNEIGYAYGPGGTYLCPDDPSFNTSGEPGMYYDTQLGGLGEEAKCQWNLPCDANWCCSDRAAIPQQATVAQRIAAWRTRRAVRKTVKKALSGLGSIPTDAELASVYGWTPVTSGWIASNQGFYTGPWVPPNGWRPSGPGFGPPTSLNGLRDVVATSPAAPGVMTSATDVLQALNDHNAKVLALTAAGTLIAGIAAMLTIVRTVKLLKTDQ